MALKQADILEHNNPAYALMDANELRGYYGIDLLTERDTIPIDKRSLIQMVLCRDEGMTYSYVGLTVDDADWTNDANWVVTGGGDVIPEIVHVNTTEELTAALYIERESLLVVLHADMNLFFGNLRCSNLTIIGPYKLSLSYIIATLNQVNITISIYSECHLNDTTARTSNLFFLPNTSNGQKLLMRFRKLTTELPLQFGGKETTTFTIHCDNALEYIEPIAPNTILLNQENFGSPKIEICDQTDVEIDVPTENTKATSALRAWQGFVYWCANTVFAGLNTTAKTIIGALNELAANTLKGNTTVHTPLIDADSFGVWDSVNSVFKRISAAAIKAYVKFGLKASDVENDSNLLGAYLNDVLNVADAIEKPLIQDGDALAMSRMNGSEAENIFVLAENAKAYFTDNVQSVYLDGSNIPDAPQYPSGTKLLMQNPAGVELVPISTIGAVVTAGYVRKDGTNISSVYGALNLNSLVLFKEVGESIGTATVSDLKTAFNLPDTGFLYNTVVTNTNETIYFTCSKGGDFSVKCRFKCSIALNRTITLIPALPVTLCIDSIFETLITNGGGFIYGTEKLNKCEFDVWGLAISSSLDTLDDKIEWRNTRGNTSYYYTENVGVVDLTSSGLTLALTYVGDAVEHVKEITIKGSLNQKA